jgi:hypothetical protein
MVGSRFAFRSIVSRKRRHHDEQRKVMPMTMRMINDFFRFCLVIDPQLQGIIWIKNKEAGSGLQVTRMGHPKMLNAFELAIDQGDDTQRCFLFFPQASLF